MLLSPIVYLLLVTLCTTIVLYMGLYALRHRQQPGALPFTVLMIIAASWALTSAFSLLLPQFEAKLLLRNIGQIPTYTASAVWLIMVLEYGGYQQWLQRRWLIALFLPAVIIVGLIWTNDWHHLIRLSVTLRDTRPYSTLVVERGPLFIWTLVYAHGLLILTMIMLIRILLRIQHAYRPQVIAMIVALILSVVGGIVDALQASPLPPLDMTVLMFIPSGMIISYALFKYRLFDIVPSARHNVIDQISDGVIVVDVNGRILDINPAAEKILKRIAPYYGDGYLTEPVNTVLSAYPEWLAAYQRDSDQIISFTITHDTDVPIYFDVRVVPFRNRRGHITGYLTTCRDITHIKTAAAIETQKDRIRILKETFDAASHDLKTPLSIVYTSLHLAQRLVDRLEQQSADDDTDMPPHEIIQRISGYHDKIRIQAERLEFIVDEVLDLISISSNLTINTKPDSLNEMVRLRTSILIPKAEARNIHIETVFDSFIPPMNIDSARLDRAVHCLLDNAIRYTSDGGIVTVRTRKTSEDVQISISDTGIGISQDDFETIFEPFFRVDSARSSDTGGAGLGLTISRILVEAHGGYMSVESEIEKGATFTIHLPLSLISQ